MSEAPLKATLKAGRDYDAPWLTVDASTPEELVNRLNALGEVNAYDALVSASQLLIASRNVGMTVKETSAPQAPWPNNAKPVADVRMHPEGKTCGCGATLQYKEVTRRSDGKTFKFWACPNQQKRDDGHESIFAS